MTKEQAEQFLKEVTGRKIRSNWWDKGDYIIPTGKWDDKTYVDPYLWGFECINPNNRKGWVIVGEGFSENLCGNFWEYLENFERYLERI